MRVTHEAYFSDEIVAKVLSALPGSAIAQASATCTQWYGCAPNARTVGDAPSASLPICRHRLVANSDLWQKLYTSSLSKSIPWRDLDHQVTIYADQQKWRQAYSALLVSITTGGLQAKQVAMLMLAVQLQRRYQAHALSAQYLKGHSGAVICLAAWGNLLVSGCIDKTVRVWDKRSGLCKAVLTAPSPDPPHAIHMPAENRILVRYKMAIHVWMGIQLQQLAFTFQSEVIDSAAYGNFLFVTCLGRKTIEVFNVDSGRKLHEFHLDQASEMIHFDAGVVHGTKVLLVALDDTILLLSQATGQSLSTVYTPQPQLSRPFAAVQLHPDNSATVTAGSLLSSKGYSSLGCPACYYTSDVLGVAIKEETSHVGHKVFVTTTLLKNSKTAHQRRWSVVKQTHSNMRIQVSYQQGTDVSFLFCREDRDSFRDSFTDWEAHTALKVPLGWVDAGYRPVSLLHGKHLLASTKSNQLVMYELQGLR